MSSKISTFILIVFCSGSLMLFSNTEASSSNSDSITHKVEDVEKRKEIAKNYLESLNENKNGWVDPYDMLSRDKPESFLSKKSNIDNEYNPVFSDIKGEVIGSNNIPEADTVIKNSGELFPNPKNQICVLDSIYVSRWLKMLISKIETDSFFEPSALVIPLNSDTVSELKTITTKTVNIGELDELVTNLISKTTVTSKETFDWASFISKFGYGLLITLGCGLFAYFFYIFLILRPIWTIVWCIIIICIFWHWMHLYQKKLAQKHAESMHIPSECRKNDFGLFEAILQYFKSYVVDSDCTKYYEALMVDPFWEVSFSVAFSETVSAMVFQPLYSGSKAINASIKQLLDGLSFTGITIVVVFIFFLMVMLCNYRIKFPFFMGALEPGVAQRNYVEDVKPYKTLKAVGNLVQKSVQTIENQDRITSGLFQKELCKDVSKDSLKRNKKIISREDNDEDCKSVECLGASQLTCQECEKSQKLDSIVYLADKLSKVEEELKVYNYSKNRNLNDNYYCEENNICSESEKLISSLSSNGERTEFVDVNNDEFVGNSCSACESNKQNPNVCCGMSEQNGL